ncbi:MAG: flavodoxin family protein [Spirochaetales bacterium]|nr:flavodoxin family protein [Spirochaetales bacterium]
MIITAFDGSPRKNGNSRMLLNAFIAGAKEKNSDIKIYKTDEMDIKPCRGCLMCNTLKLCAIRKDNWQDIADRIAGSDILVFSSPIYFHHTTASMKRLLDRLRSFIHVQITVSGLIHTPHEKWNKKICLLTAHGSSAVDDALPLVDLFKFLSEVMGPDNEFYHLNAVRLAASGQISFDEERLRGLYKKLGIPVELAVEDAERNAGYLKEAENLGCSLIGRKI